MNRSHRVNLESDAQLCEQLVDRCQITEVLEKVHCQGFIPINNLADQYSFVDRLIDESVSYKDVPFSVTCCSADPSCNDVKIDYECSDANEWLIRNVTKEYMSKKIDHTRYENSIYYDIMWIIRATIQISIWNSDAGEWDDSTN